jgi:predicted AlkP superfamily pyrophosphatase or phosphodiesterase
MIKALLPGVMLLLSLTPGAVHAEPVLMISVDGLRPGDVIDAERRGLKIPNLRRFLAEGSYASGVVGVLPTVTYPSHTTLITGVSPDQHGVVNNTTFDPKGINQTGWYWYARDIRVPTLWDAAAKAGLSVANVFWPVSVGASSIRWNLPQYWRTGHPDDLNLMKALATPGLVDRLETDVGKPYVQGIDETVEADENRGAFAVQLIKDQKPDFATVYLTGLDHQQHESGPDTPEAHAVLERIDAIIGTLIATERAMHPDAVIALVSDHGFAPTTVEVDFFRAFIDEKLITLDENGKVADWLAMPWPSGGSVAIALAKPDDSAVLARVSALLDRLKADPDMHIASVLRKSEIAAVHGNPQASFYVEMAPGAMSGGFKGPTADMVRPSRSKGMHGYFPASAVMRSTFMIMGPRIPKGHDFGEIDMRAIAPTLARIMNVPFPSAAVPALE